MKITSKSSSSESFSRIFIEQGPLWVLCIGVIINVVLFFIPSAGNAIALKTLLIALSVLAAFFIGLAIIFRNGVFSFPKDAVVYALASLALVVSVAAFFSSSFRLSFWGSLLGNNLNAYSAFAILLLIGVFFFANHVVKTHARAQSVLLVFQFSVLVLFIYHTIRFFLGPKALTFGIFSGVFGTPAGSWLDLAIILTLGVFMTFLILEFRVFGPTPRLLLGILGGVFLVALLVMNIQVVWIVSGFVSLVMILSIASFAFWNSEQKSFSRDRRLPIFMLIIFFVSIAAVFLGPRIQSFAQEIGSIQAYNYVRPSLGSTAYAGWYSIKHNPLIGVGLGNFNHAFVNGNTLNPSLLDVADNIASGYGWVPTLLATTGILGIAAVAVVIGAFFLRFLRMVKIGFKAPDNRFFVFEYFALGIVVACFAIVDTPSLPVLALGAVFMGGWYGLIRTYDPSRQFVVPFLKDPRVSFFGLIVLLGIASGLVLCGTVVLRMYWSERSLVRGIIAANEKNKIDAERYLNQAIKTWKTDTSLRVGALYVMSELRAVIQKPPADKNALKKQVEQLSAQSLSLATDAANYNRIDYRAWAFVGNVLASFGEMGIAGAYDNAAVAYKEAEKQNPKDPRIKSLIQAVTNVQKARRNQPTPPVVTPPETPNVPKLR